jgi:hypothetical protein
MPKQQGYDHIIDDTDDKKIDRKTVKTGWMLHPRHRVNFGDRFAWSG